MNERPSDQTKEDRFAVRLRAGDTTVLDEILTCHGGMVESQLRKRFSPAVNDADLEDIMAVALFRLWQSRERFDPRKAGLRAWLYVLARSATLDLLRKRNLEARAVAGRARDGRGEARSDVESPGGVVSALIEAIGDLPEKDQAIVAAWLYSDGSSDWTRHVAQEWKMSSTNVRVRLSRILDRMRQRFHAQGLE